MIQLNVPNPCSKKWVELKGSSPKRYCESCDTVVVDFSTMTDKELFTYFSEQKLKVCGRFREDQLNRELKTSFRENRMFPIWLVLFGIVPNIESASAQNVSINQSVFVDDRRSVEQLSVTQDTTYKVFRGKVLAQDDGLGIPGAIINIKNTEVACQTDINGDFSLTIPDSLWSEKITVQIISIGFETIEMTINEVTLLSAESYIMRLDSNVIGETLTVFGKRKWWQFWKNSIPK
jgi:hypothetical protein